jgi:hypothetical protein
LSEAFFAFHDGRLFFLEVRDVAALDNEVDDLALVVPEGGSREIEDDFVAFRGKVRDFPAHCRPARTCSRISRSMASAFALSGHHGPFQNGLPMTSSFSPWPTPGRCGC